MTARSNTLTDARPLPGPAVLFVPAANPRAMAKAASLPVDAVIYDLEDAVAPSARTDAREALREALSRPRPNFVAVRINHPTSPDFTEDLLVARACKPDAIVVPKVDHPADLAVVEEALEQTDALASLALWAMIETSAGVSHVSAIAGSGGRLGALVVGTNDLGAATGATRAHMHPWLMAVVLAARTNRLTALDGVHDAIDDTDALTVEAREGAAMGFDGKTLIHPAQIEPARGAFRPSPDDIAHARAVRDAFAATPDAGVLRVGGRMVERLHLTAACRTLSKIGETA